MDPSSTWLSDLGIDDEYPSFTHQYCEMGALDQLTSQHVIEGALDDDSLQNSAFSSECYTSYPAFTPPRNTAAGAERPAKLPKSAAGCVWSSRKAPLVSAGAPPPHVASSPRILSFGRQDQDPPHLLRSFAGATVKPEEGVGFAVVSSTAAQGPKRPASKAVTRPPSQAQDHIIAERKRREKISERFIALSAVVPGLKKTDKVSILGDAVKYVKHLEERVRTLEEQTARTTVESVVIVKRSLPPPASDDDTSSSGENSDVAGLRPGKPLPEVEAKVSERSVLVRLHCEKRKGALVKVLAELERVHLAVVNTSVVPFASSALDITVVAQMEEEFSLTVKGLVKHLSSACRELV